MEENNEEDIIEVRPDWRKYEDEAKDLIESYIVKISHEKKLSLCEILGILRLIEVDFLVDEAGYRDD